MTTLVPPQSPGVVTTLPQQKTAVVTTLPQQKTTVVTTLPEVRKPFLNLPEKCRLEALERRKFIAMTERLKREMGLGTMHAACLYVAAHKSAEFPILRQGGRNGASRLTWPNRRKWTERIQEAEKRLGRAPTDEETLLALVDNYRRGSQRESWEQRYNEFRVHFCKLYFHENCLDVSKAWRDACYLTRKLAPDAPLPTNASARYYLKHLPKEIAIREREGEVAWRNKAGDYSERDWSEIMPGELVIGDNRTFDFYVRVETAPGSGVWKAVRPTLSALMDARSWYIVSWMITVESIGTREQIKLLAQYCCETGGRPPARAYYDNGMDYKAQGFALPKEIEGGEYSIFKSLGMAQQFAKPFNGRAKTIEPNFEKIKDDFDKMLPSYLGSNILQRPDAAAYFEKHPEELPELKTLAKAFAAWLAAYHKRPKSGVILQGKSPEEVWNSRPDKPPMSPEDLKLAFLRPLDARTVGRGRSITVNGKRYFTDSVLFGERVIVKEDIFDPESVWLFDRDGALLDVARTRRAVKAIVEGDPEEEALLRERMKRQARLEKEARQMSRELIGSDKVSPLEWLLTAGTNVKLIKRGEIGTVKGKSHTYKRIAPAVDVLAQSVGTDQSPEPEHQEPPEADPEIEAIDRELDRMLAGGKAAPEPGPEPETEYDFSREETPEPITKEEEEIFDENFY